MENRLISKARHGLLHRVRSTPGLRGFSCCLLMASGALALQACDAKPQSVRDSVQGEHLGARPNIVVILTDDAGISDVGAFGGEIDTPSIDALANDGIMFRTFYANARCSPTRASLLTGMYPARAGFGAGTLGGWQEERRLPAYRGRLTEALPTLPEILRDAGYHTLMAGKWHLGGSPARDDLALQRRWAKAHPGWPHDDKEFQSEFNALPRQRGFEEYFGAYVGETRQFLPVGTTQHRYFKNNTRAVLTSTGIYSPYAPSAPQPAANDAERPGDDTSDRRALFFAPEGVTDEAISMLGASRRRDASKPFFLYLAFQAPHAPLEAPRETVEKYLERYQNPQILELARVQRWREKGWLPPRAAVETHVSSVRDASGAAQRYAVHAALLETVDRAIGKLVSALKTEGVFDNTLIVLLSDNGGALNVSELVNAPFRGAKGLLWQGGIRTHAILHWPAVITAPRVTGSIGWVGDLMPTILEVAGAPYTAGVDAARNGVATAPDGRSLASILRGRELGAPQYLFFNDRGQQAVIRLGRWKLLINPGWYGATQRRGTTELELYDLLRDPTERHDLAAKEPRIVARLLKKAKAWQASQGIVDYGYLLENPG